MLARFDLGTHRCGCSAGPRRSRRRSGHSSADQPLDRVLTNDSRPAGVSLAEPVCRARDRHHPQRAPRPPHRPERGPPSSSSAQLFPLLPRVSNPPRPREGCFRATRRRTTCARPHRRPAPRRWSPPPLRPKRGVVAGSRPCRHIPRRSEARSVLARWISALTAAVAAPDQEGQGVDRAARRSISRWIEFWPTTGGADAPRCPLVPQESAKFLETYWRRGSASRVEDSGRPLAPVRKLADQRRADGKIVGVELIAAALFGWPVLSALTFGVRATRRSISRWIEFWPTTGSPEPRRRPAPMSNSVARAI